MLADGVAAGRGAAVALGGVDAGNRLHLDVVGERDGVARSRRGRGARPVRVAVAAHVGAQRRLELGRPIGALVGAYRRLEVGGARVRVLGRAPRRGQVRRVRVAAQQVGRGERFRHEGAGVVVGADGRVREDAHGELAGVAAVHLGGDQQLGGGFVVRGGGGGCALVVTQVIVRIVDLVLAGGAAVEAVLRRAADDGERDRDDHRADGDRRDGDVDGVERGGGEGGGGRGAAEADREDEAVPAGGVLREAGVVGGGRDVLQPERGEDAGIALLRAGHRPRAQRHPPGGRPRVAPRAAHQRDVGAARQDDPAAAGVVAGGVDGGRAGEAARLDRVPRPAAQPVGRRAARGVGPKVPVEHVAAAGPPAQPDAQPAQVAVARPRVVVEAQHAQPRREHDAGHRPKRVPREVELTQVDERGEGARGDAGHAAVAQF